jgi:hypothetical protein
MAEITNELFKLLNRSLSLPGANFHLVMSNETWETILAEWEYPTSYHTVTNEESIVFVYPDEVVRKMRDEMRERQSVPFNGRWYRVEIRS